MSDLIIRPDTPAVVQPRHAIVKIGGMAFKFLETPELLESPARDIDSVIKFVSQTYHMVKMVLLELEAKGLVTIERGEKSEAAPESALDKIDPT